MSELREEMRAWDEKLAAFDALRASDKGRVMATRHLNGLSVILGGFYVTVPLALAGWIFAKFGRDRIAGWLCAPLCMNAIVLMCWGH